MSELNTEVVAPLVPPSTETQNTVVEPAETAVAEQPEAKPEKTAEQRDLEAKQRRITKLERTNARLYADTEQFKTRLEQLEKSQPQEQRQKVEVDPQELDKVVRTRAQELAHQERLTERIDTVVAKGSGKFSDFNALTNAMAAELPLWDQGKPTAALEALLEMDDPAALVAHLGKNPDIAAELADLSPIRLTRRLEAIERGLKAPIRQPSAAPKPLEPEKGSAAPSIPDPDKDPAGWRRWRNESTKK